MAGVSEIIDRHKNDCESIRKLVDAALQHRDDIKKSTELMEFANIFAATVAIVQDGERKVYNIDSTAVELVRLAEEELAKRMQDR